MVLFYYLSQNRSFLISVSVFMVLNLTSITLITYLKRHEFILYCNESNFDQVRRIV
jgi:hypothetical protein